MKKEIKKKEINTKLSLYDLKGKAAGDVQLDKALFDGRVNKTLLYEANKMYEAAKRKGCAKSKTRSEVSGGGAKPWKQKGTGRARVGSSRNPLWRHGGTIFGPKPRDYSFSMPRKAVRGALLSMLNARLSEGAIKPIVRIELKEAKTKEVKKIFDNLKIEGKTLLAVDLVTEDLKRAVRNLKPVTLKAAKNINARDVLLNDYLVIEQDALEKLSERLK